MLPYSIGGVRMARKNKRWIRWLPQWVHCIISSLHKIQRGADREQLARNVAEAQLHNELPQKAELKSEDR